jgi:chitinase
MYGINGVAYTQGSADFIVAMTEALIQGFNTGGGYFFGIPADKIAVGLPACSNAAGGGFTDTAAVSAAIKYIRGFGPPPGSYLLANVNGYPTLRGMMTWSVNWDAVNTCGGSWEYANNYQHIFGTSTSLSEITSNDNFLIYPNPSNGEFKISNFSKNSTIEFFNLRGEIIYRLETKDTEININLQYSGMYLLKIISKDQVIIKKLIVE